MSGQVSERERSSIIRPSHCTRALDPCELWPIRTSPRYPMIPPSLEIDLARMFELVLGARWTTLAPVSFHTSPDATPTFRWSARAPSPIRKEPGYSITRLAPIEPPTHSTVPRASTIARFVFRLNTSFDQFWTVV